MPNIADEFEVMNKIVEKGLKKADEGKKEDAINAFNFAIEYLKGLDWNLKLMWDSTGSHHPADYIDRIQKRIDDYDLFWPSK